MLKMSSCRMIICMMIFVLNLSVASTTRDVDDVDTRPGSSPTRRQGLSS